MGLATVSRGRLARRDLLRAGAGALAATSVSSCTFFETEAVEEGGSQPASGGKGPEAPMLADAVEQGELPRVEERLPANPLEVQPLDRVGTYGGTWHSSMITQEDLPWLENTIGYEPLVRWSPNWNGATGTQILPNLADFDADEEGQEFVFTLREGLTWSDGEPCTVDDIAFAFGDVHTYPQMHPEGIYSLWTSPTSGNPGELEKMDDHTIRLVFEEPKPGFLEEIASNIAPMVLPKHYLQRFHAKYNDDVDELVEEHNLNDWVQLFEQQSDVWTNPDIPTLNAWKVTNPLGKGTHVTAVRNPYYWKVDPDGSQLPYIDEVVCEVLLDVEVQVVKVVNGEFDMQLRNFATTRNRPVIARGSDDGDYEMFTVTPELVNTMIIGLNQTYPDEQLREVFANKDFRIGLSYAINRERVIETIYAGQGEPWQCAPLPGDPLENEELGRQYTEYDTALANEHLDQAGLTERDADGMRLRSDGEPLTVRVVVNADSPDHVDALELVRQDWREVGVDLDIDRVAETLYWERVEANQAPAGTWTGGPFLVRVGQGGNHYYLPSNPRGASRFGSTWAQWYATNGEDGQEPPDEVRRQLELHDEMRMTYDADEATQIAKQILEITKEQFYYIGISTPAEEYGIVKNDFHNVPSSMPSAVAYKTPGPTNPEQYFISAQ